MAQQPVAQVWIDSPVPHLDRLFDYAIPPELADQVQPGVRVRLRFAGRRVNGIVAGLLDSSEHADQLKPLDRVISPEPVLTAQVAELVAAVAERYAGSVHDVLRVAVPPRHARAEGSVDAPSNTPTVIASPDDLATDSLNWQRYTHGTQLIEHLRADDGPPLRAVFSSAPAHPWTLDVASLVRVVLAQPRGGVIVVVPDAADVQRLQQELAPAKSTTAILTADLGPERRYRQFLRVLRAHARLVIGTRSAVFAPMPDLRLVVVWGDGEDALWEQHAPYWNARDVAALRSHQSGCALVVGSPSRTTEAQSWCESGWAVSMQAVRDVVQRDAPLVQGVGEQDVARDPAAQSARIPHSAWVTIKQGLQSGPVLVQVGRRGYITRLSCQDCRTPIDCSCGGPLQLTSGHAVPRCLWCGALAGHVTCPTCGGHTLRAVAIGAERTAEEFGRAFANTPILWSAGEHIRRDVPDQPAIVVATQGAEPVAAGGYAALVIADARGALQRTGLRAIEDAAQRWFAAALLVRPRAPIVVAADAGLPAVQALIRWNAPWLAQRELTDRASAGMPPVMRMIVLRGEATDIGQVIGDITTKVRVLGPVDGRAILLVARDVAPEVIRQLRAITVQRSARRSAGVVHVIVDPREP